MKNLLNTPNHGAPRPLLGRTGPAALLIACLSLEAFSLSAADNLRRTHIEILFGLRATPRTVIAPRLAPGKGNVQIESVSPAAAFSAGAGEIGRVVALVSWEPPRAKALKPHGIWQHFLAHGEPGQVQRVSEDPGLVPDAPVLTVETVADGTRGFSVALESLLRHRALWLPEHDAYVRVADGPDFAAHIAGLKGQRVLHRVLREPEATLEQYRARWTDFGNPEQWTVPWQTEWLGARGHLVGTVARHGSVYKFGIDRWGNVRPDFASPHKFRLDLEWPGGQWAGQVISNGLPLVISRFTNQFQTCELEQFAGDLSSGQPRSPGEIPSALHTRAVFEGTGNVRFRIRLATENPGRHPELRRVAGRDCIVDRETGSIWLSLEPGPGLALKAVSEPPDEKNPRLGIDCSGELRPGRPATLVIKLPSPVVSPAGLDSLAGLDFNRERARAMAYWEDWLGRGARFEVPEDAVNDLFRANLWHALMLPRFRESGLMDLPYSNFAYGQANADWPINQAVYVDYMLYGLRGYFAVAEAELASMYRTQQRPDGRIGGYAEWGVYSPGMLYAVGQNFLLANDVASFERLLPASLKALDWCLGEIARGQASTDAPGLIVAPLNDLTHDSRAWAFPNAYFVAGLDVFGRALAARGHPRAPAVRAAAAKLRSDVERAFARAAVRAPVVQLSDGSWANYVPCDALTRRRLLDQWYPTDVDCGPLHLARLSAIDPRGWLADAMLHDHEDNLFLNAWGAANEPVYNPQGTAYLLRDEPEAAIRTFYSMLACAFSHGQLSPLEHRWAWGQYYAPPSTDGAWFELYRNMLLNELSGGLFVGQAVPRAWLDHGKIIAVSNAPTCFGPVNLRLESAARQGRIRATVEFTGERRPPELLVRLRHPHKARMSSASVNGRPWTDLDPSKEFVRIAKPTLKRYEIVVDY